MIYRLEKFVRRNKTAVSAATTIVLALLAVFVPLEVRSAKCECRGKTAKDGQPRRPSLSEFVIRHSSFVIWLTPPPPAKLPSKKWHDLIQQVWHTDPLICPQCWNPIRVIAVIDQREVVEKILRHLGLWEGHTAAGTGARPAGRRGRAVDPRTDESQSPSLEFSL